MRVWIFALLVALAAVVAVPVASAAPVNVPPGTCTFAAKCSQGGAYAACMNYTAQAAAIFNAAEHHSSVAACPNAGDNYLARMVEGGTNYNAESYMSQDRFYFDVAKVCSAQPNYGAGMSKATSGSGGTMCYQGCSYAPVGNSASIQLGNGPVYTPASAWAPTGSTCATGDGSGDLLAAQEDCVQQGSLTQCMKSDGRQCVTASSGKQFCWKQTEQGVKYSENDAAAAVQGNTSISAPTTKPTNGGEWTQGGSGTVTSKSGGSTTVTNITTWISNFGSEGNGKAEGEGDDKKDDDAPTATTGQGCDQSSFQCSDMSSVQCNQLIQTWYLRCKGVELNGGANCDSPPTCTGNAADCFISKQLWNMRCDGKSDAEAGAPQPSFDAEMEGEGNGTDEPDVASIGTGDTADTSLSMWREKDVSAELDRLDASGFLGGSDQCPQMPEFNVAGGIFHIELSGLCEILRNVGILVMALAYWIALRILAKAK